MITGHILKNETFVAFVRCLRGPFPWRLSASIAAAKLIWLWRYKMPMKKHKSKRNQRKMDLPVTSAEKLQQQIVKSPDIRAVLEIAMRARELEAARPALVIGIATDIVASPSNSQCPV